jgi:small subunit ribosomal protein S16
VAVKIRLKRLGKIRAPFYRIVVADSHVKRDGKTIEEIGQYHPKSDPSHIQVNSERVQYWLSVGAQPTEPVKAILSATGDWQQFKGLPAPPPLLLIPERPSKRIRYDEPLAAAHGHLASAPAVTKKADAPKADAPKADAPKADAPKADAPATETPAEQA